VFWNEEPAALIVPLPDAAVEDPELGVVVPLEVVVELDEEHAARAIAMTASPAVVTCRLRPRCISVTPYRFYRFFGRDEQPGRPVSLQTVVSEYSLSASSVLADKCRMDRRWLEG
jgi:hypothetical protein